MDWAAIASILGERSDRPIMILDRYGRIRMFNHAMEQVLGWPRFEVEGELWTRVCAPPEHRDEARRWIAEALRGALWSYEAQGLTNTGSRIVFRFEFALVGKGSTQGLLVTAAHWKLVERPLPELAGRDLDYEITGEPAEFGLLSRLLVDSERIRLPQGGARCHLLIYGLQRPCEDCPAVHDVVAQRDAPPEWPRISVRCVGEGVGAFEIVSGDQLDDGLVRMRIRTINDHTLEAIHAAKIQQLSDRAKLSSRERQILTYLVLGRTIEDISKLVGIAIRTVKFHQANVLQKLGADSRSDLMRLLF